MSILTPNKRKMPWVVGGGGSGAGPHGHSVFLRTDPANTHNNVIFPECWVVPGNSNTAAYEAIASGSTSADFKVISIRDINGKKLPQQFISVADLDANTYILEAMPLGNLEFYMVEDADTTPITDANAGPGKYADVVVTDPSAPTGENPVGAPIGTYRINSDTVCGTSTGLTVQLLGVAGIAGQPAYSATTLASPRVFRVKATLAAASQ